MRVVNLAMDVGIKLIDTANTRGGERRSDEYIGKTLRSKREQALVATKAAMRMGDGPNQSGAPRQHLMAELEKSLRCLDPDFIDLYQVQFPDPDTPFEETIRALDGPIAQV